jgi:hypothetical protein
MEIAARNLKAGLPMEMSRAVDMKMFEEIVELKRWQEIEEKYPCEQD